MLAQPEPRPLTQLLPRQGIILERHQGPSIGMISPPAFLGMGGSAIGTTGQMKMLIGTITRQWYMSAQAWTPMVRAVRRGAAGLLLMEAR